MILWQVVLAAGAVGSLAMWLRQFTRYRRPWREGVYPLIAVMLTVASALLYAENTELRDPTQQARILAKSWPESVYDGQFHEAEAKGIVLAGLRYLETYKQLSPDTYERHLRNYDHTDFSDSLEATRAADAMIATIRSYAGEQVKLK
jgi:hypothetical protein